MAGYHRRQTTIASRRKTILELQPNQLRACFNGRCIELSTLEFKLLELFHHNPGRIYSREQIIDLIYDDFRVVSDRTVDSHIRNLRKKIRDIFDTPEIIQSVYGAGYKYTGPS